MCIYKSDCFSFFNRHFSNFPLVGMRKVSAIVGALIAPVCYMTIRNFGHSRSAATFAAILMVFGTCHNLLIASLISSF